MQINESTSITVTAKFYDEEGSPVTPTSATYRLINEAGTEIIATTTVTPTGPTHDITILGTNNMIQVANANKELRILTYTFLYAPDKTGADEIEYEINKLRGLELPGD